MLVQPGAIYRLHLSIYNATSLGPGWLVGALGATFPLAELFAIESYSDVASSVLVRWTRRAGNIDKGTTVTAVTAGIQVPGATIPTANVEDVQMVSAPTSPPPPAATVARLLGAIGLIGIAAYFSVKIGKKHGYASTAK